jgi:hypothetical protein
MTLGRRPTRVDQLSRDLAERLRAVREDFYGEHGAQFLADDLGLPLKTWVNYERRVAVPGVTLLKFIVLTGANPHWLLTGRGRKYLRRGSKGP